MLNNNPLIYAIDAEDVSKVKELLKTQAQLLITEAAKHGYTPLHCAAMNADNGANTRPTQIFNILLLTAIQLGVAETVLNKQNNSGSTPFTQALGEAKVIDDIFIQRAINMIQYGAKLPNTPKAKRIFEKLPLEIQKVIQEKLDAYQQKITSETQTTNPYHQSTLIKYTAGQGGSSSTTTSSDLRNRGITRTDEDKTKKQFEMAAF